MKKSSLFFLLATFASLSFLASCTSTTPSDDTAKQMSLTEIKESAAYPWFKPEFYAYQPDAAKVSQIKTLFNASKHKFYVFVNPSCSCVGTTKLFPQVTSILANAGVPEGNIEIYSMGNASYKHPYQSQITIKALPTIYMLRNGVIVDTLMSLPVSPETLEEKVLEGLSR